MRAMILRLAGLLFRAAFACAAVAQAIAADYTHTSLAGTIAIRAEQRLIAVGDVANEASFCEPKSGMICFRAKDFRFAIPSMASDRTKWSHDGERYEAQRINETLFGKAGPYWLIRQQRSNGFEFIFSDQFGLVVIQGGMRPSGSYILMQPCGFASAPDCR